MTQTAALSRGLHRAIASLSIGAFGLFLAAVGCRHAEAETRTVAVTDDLARVVAEAPPGTTFLLAPGVHRIATIVPKDGQIFDGQGRATLSGAVSIANFRKDGAMWRTKGPRSLMASDGGCDTRRHWASRPDGCLYPEDLFVDGWPVRRVFEAHDVRGGSWHQDRTTGDITIGFDPHGHEIELGHTEAAFTGIASDVIIRNLVIERFGPAAQFRAIQGDRGTGWRIERNLIRQNGGAGIRLGNGMRVVGNRILNNGQIGVTGIGDDIFVADNEIAGNNTHGFSPAWEAGGTKFVRTDRLVVERNCVHHNDGTGLWTDIDNRNSLFADNIAAFNAGIGIFHEISGQALIAGNLAIGNGAIEDSPWSSQIAVSGSIDTTVWRNRAVVAPDYGNGIYIMEEGRANQSKRIHDGPTYAARNNVVLENEIVFAGAHGVYGLGGHEPGSGPLHERNRFTDNLVRAPDARARFREDTSRSR